MTREFFVFHGAKIALLCGDRLIVYKRDRKLGIPFPGLWDLPGGGREGEESPIQCVLRELEEEFAIRIPPERVVWQRHYFGQMLGHPGSYFLVGSVTEEEVRSIRFGDEGERWQLMSIDAFLAHPEGTPHLQDRLRAYLEKSEFKRDR